MTAAGLVISGVAGLGILVVGVCYLLVPRAMAATFGLPAVPPEDATPWLRLKGVRDLTTGVVAGVLLLTATPTVIGWVLLTFTLIPLGDAATIIRSAGDVRVAWTVHGATAALMLIGAALLLVG
ncbi:MAG TPA: DUF4267 domain-containing protein [Phototrophicaceae bacterium]|nr:DUF4267 domain-containing protein [Phototrophicaceae bacterium]